MFSSARAAEFALNDVSAPMTWPSSGVPAATIPTCALSLRQQAYAAFQEAYGNRYLCGSCHRRPHAEGDWLCRACRAEIERFELADAREATIRLVGEPLDWAVIPHKKTRRRIWEEVA